MTEATDKSAVQRRTVPRVLVVDDDPRLRPLMVRLLREEGFAVEGAATVAAALDFLKAHEFDVMLCDRRLPDGNGCDLMRAALRLRPIKGVAVTGSPKTRTWRKAGPPGSSSTCRNPSRLRKCSQPLSAH